MKTPTYKLQKMKGVTIKKRGQGNIMKSASNISSELFRKQIHSSLDLNKPAQIELQNQYSFEVIFVFNYSSYIFSSRILIS